MHPTIDKNGLTGGLLLGVQLDDELIFVIRRFLVAVGSECTDELTVLLLDLQAGSDFHGYILAIGVVDEVFAELKKVLSLKWRNPPWEAFN